MNSSRKEYHEAMKTETVTLILQLLAPCPAHDGPSMFVTRIKKRRSQASIPFFAPFEPVYGLTLALKRKGALENERHRGQGGAKAGVLSELHLSFSVMTLGQSEAVCSPRGPSNMSPAPYALKSRPRVEGSAQTEGDRVLKFHRQFHGKEFTVPNRP